MRDTHSLAAVLEQLVSTVTALGQTLHEEADAIVSRNTSALARCNTAKQTQLSAIDALDHQRRTLLSKLGWEETSDFPEPRLNQIWQALLIQLQTCQDANQANGVMLDTQRMHTQKTLDLIAGNNAETQVYQADGSASQHATKQPFAKA